MIEVNSAGSPVSAAFAQSVAQPLVAFSAQLLDGGQPVDCDIARIELQLGDSADSEGSSSGIPLGGVFSAQMSAQLVDCADQLLGEELEVRIGVGAGGSFEYVTVAWVTVTYSSTAAGLTSLEAVGRISAKMSGTALSLAGERHTFAGIASSIEAASGVAVDLGSFADTSQGVALASGCTCKAALRSMALALGGYAAETHDGRVLISPLPASATCSASGDHMPTLPRLSDDDYAVDGLTVIVPPEDEESDEVVYEFGTGRVAIEDQTATAASAAALWANLRGKSWRPGTVELSVLDPRLTPFDAVQVALDGVTRMVPAFGITATYDGGYFGSFSATGPSESAEVSYEAGPMSLAVGEAKSAAQIATSSAREARVAAEQAQGAAAQVAQRVEEVNDAANAALQSISGNVAAAQQSADDAAAAAAVADGKAVAAASAANTAQSMANAANASANAALVSLSEAQDVIGVVNWITQHGTYSLTDDAAVDPDKVYYERTGSGTQADPYAYAPVAEPSAEGLSSYYELSIDQALSQFVAAHLALTNEGLFVLKDGNSWKTLMKSDGWEIRDPQNATAMSIGAAGVDFAAGRTWHIGSDDAYILYTPASGNSPASIVIGGAGVTLGGSKPLSELLSDVAGAVEDAGAALQTANDVPIVTLSSTNGTVFKRNLGVSTVIVATVFTPGGRIDNAAELRRRFGAGAYLEWGWRDVVTDASHVLLSSDERIGSGGFTLTVSPDDIDTQAVITCTLNY